ncbi:thiamine-phosphate kinase [Chitinimonas sp.]|uniref:thiamine-phosphate kinase n=1 Tax=Chitinimonas sp. TaxID=1934313 RepID=UPI0035B4E70F
MAMALGEFELIERFFKREQAGVLLGVGDDAALLAPSPGMQLAVSADTLVEGRHFFAGTDPYAIGWKSLAVNLSDLAAMGATPRWFTLCLTLPRADADWLQAFSGGLFALAEAHGIALVGGDTTSGPLAISIQIIGELAPAAALRRDAARLGDDIWLSGPTGAAALAVQQRLGKLDLAGADLLHCARRLDYPEPRVQLGLALAGLAHAAIDVSDGLLADLGHICQRSGLGAALLLDALPGLPLALPPAADALQVAQLSGGDDYELCFTAPVSARAALIALGERLGLPMARIGSMQAGAAVTVLGADGRVLPQARAGFNHFA